MKLESIRCERGNINYVIKREKVSLLGSQVLLTGLWILNDIQNSRQHRSKNKLVRENAVTRVHEMAQLYNVSTY